MSNPQGNDVVRRKWDRALFQKKAEERQRAERDAAAERQRASAAGPADADDPFAPTRAWLAPRSRTLDLDSKVGHSEIVAEARDQRSGFWCEVCKTLLKDSSAYLSHLNSRSHQRELGMSMRVKRPPPSQVKAKVDELRRKKRGFQDPPEVPLKRHQQDSHQSPDIGDKDAVHSRSPSNPSESIGSTDDAGSARNNPATLNADSQPASPGPNGGPDEPGVADDTDDAEERLAQSLGLPVAFRSTKTG